MSSDFLKGMTPNTGDKFQVQVSVQTSNFSPLSKIKFVKPLTQKIPQLLKTASHFAFDFPSFFFSNVVCFFFFSFLEGEERDGCKWCKSKPKLDATWKLNNINNKNHLEFSTYGLLRAGTKQDRKPKSEHLELAAVNTRVVENPKWNFINQSNS